MKRFSVFLCLTLLWTGALQAQLIQEWPSGPVPLVDKSPENPVLVFGAIQTKQALLMFPAEGPSEISFIRIQPIIGPRVNVHRPGFMQDSRIFAFQGPKVDETWQLSHYRFKEELVNSVGQRYEFDRKPYNSIMNGQETFTIAKTGLVFMGSFYGSRDSFRSGSFMTELECLKVLRGMVGHLPGWKAEVDARIEELSKK